MPYNTNARVVRVTAHADVQHGDPAADDGFVGIAVKTQTPPADAPRDERDVIESGEEYNLIIKGIVEIPVAGFSDPDKGELAYITTADNSLSDTAGQGKVVLGKITHLPGEQGTPLDKLRVDLDLKA